MTPLKQEAAALVAKGVNYREVAQEVSVTERTMRRWRNDPEFAEEVMRRSSLILVESIPAIYNVLSERAKAGDYQAMRLLFDRIDRAYDDYTRTKELTVPLTGDGQLTFSWMEGEE